MPVPPADEHRAARDALVEPRDRRRHLHAVLDERRIEGRPGGRLRQPADVELQERGAVFDVDDQGVEVLEFVGHGV
jgi:hypothetical protein